MSDENEFISEEELENYITEPEAETSDKSEETKLLMYEITDELTIDDDGDRSLVDIMYDKINEVLGGDNANQYFCMTFPGTILSPHTYSYDYKNNQPKPPAVEANESRLANKMFDPCQVTGSDNGRSLAQQYSTSLDMLTPKLNTKIQEAKSSLRSMLMTPYPYDFGNGIEAGLTLQQVFFRLYDDWVKLKMEWSKLQADKKAELSRKYGTGSSNDNAAQQNEYLTWYQTIAEGYLEGLNEQYSKILAVFSPNDMKIIEGILDSGSGAELEEAREILHNVRKSNPNGGYIYPVTFSPENWFELLDNSFTGIDLLESPEALSEQMYLLSSQRINLVAQANSISEMIPDEGEIKAKKDAVNDAKSKIAEVENRLINEYSQSVLAVFRAATDIMGALGEEGIASSILDRLIDKSSFKEDENHTRSNLIKALTDALTTAQNSQRAYVEASQQLSDAQMSYIESKNMQSLKDILAPIRTQIEHLDLDISNLSAKLKLSYSLSGNKTENDDPPPISDGIDEVVPNKVPKGFTQIVIQENTSTVNKSSSKSGSASASTSGASFFFCGGSSSNSEIQSDLMECYTGEGCKIQIGMSVAKINIERDWFNPGLFTLTGDMYNVTSQKIAPNEKFESVFDENRFNKMASCVFPCFPTAFVVARDVTVKLNTNKEISEQHAAAMEQHASKGGGFLFFSASKSSSSSTESSSAHVSSKTYGTTIRFTDPQVLGYYIEATPADNSTQINVSESENDEFITIIDFVKKCKELLLQHKNEMIN